MLKIDIFLDHDFQNPPQQHALYHFSCRLNSFSVFENRHFHQDHHPRSHKASKFATNLIPEIELLADLISPCEKMKLAVQEDRLTVSNLVYCSTSSTTVSNGPTYFFVPRQNSTSLSLRRNENRLILLHRSIFILTLGVCSGS